MRSCNTKSDASKKRMRQLQDGKPVIYASRCVNSRQEELLKKFSVFLPRMFSSIYHCPDRPDPIYCKKPITANSTKLQRVLITLFHYGIAIHYLKMTENITADALSLSKSNKECLREKMVLNKPVCKGFLAQEAVHFHISRKFCFLQICIQLHKILNPFISINNLKP